MNLSGPYVSGADINSDSATQLAPLGALFAAGDGRYFRYCLAGAVALVAGDVIQSPAQIANHIALTPSATAAIGDYAVLPTLGATAATANQYANGLLIVSTTPGFGQSLAISGNAAVLSAGIMTVNLERSSPVRVAITSTSRVDLQSNPYRNVIQSPVTTATGVPVGICVAAITIAQWGWLLVHGPCGVKIDGTPAVGAAVVGTGAAAGAATIASSTLATIGYMMTTGVNLKCNSVFIVID